MSFLSTAKADLYGRGYSEAPKIAHDANVYAFQLAFLLQYIGWDKTNVVGFSMVSRSDRQSTANLSHVWQGGAIAASFATAFPHLLDESVVFLASAGLMEVCDV